MHTIQLPLTPCMRFTAAALCMACAVPAAMAPATLPWRVFAVLAIAVTGLLAWRRHLRRRPGAVQMLRDGGLRCTLADGAQADVQRVRLGMVRPCLVSARLEIDDGRHLDLFVPGRSLDGAAHWSLRRAVLAFRSADGRSHGGQSDERRGM